MLICGRYKINQNVIDYKLTKRSMLNRYLRHYYLTAYSFLLSLYLFHASASSEEAFP